MPLPTLSGPRCTKKSLYFLRQKTKKGGMEFPSACTTHATETKAPFSAEVIDSTCFTPRHATTRSGYWMVVTPVSSIFNVKSIKAITLNNIPKLLENAFTFVRLKLVAWAKLVACTLLMDKLGCLFISLRTSLKREWQNNQAMKISSSPEKWQRTMKTTHTTKHEETSNHQGINRNSLPREAKKKAEN